MSRLPDHVGNNRRVPEFPRQRAHTGSNPEPRDARFGRSGAAVRPYRELVGPAVGWLVSAFCLLLPAWTPKAGAVEANVALVDHALVYNRLGAQNFNGMLFALERDLVGNTLRSDKRPRPLVLRVNEGDTLVVHFRNGLAPTANPNGQPDNQVAGRHAGFHVQGLKPVGVSDDASHVGNNASSLVGPGGTTTYTYLAEKEGTFLVTSYGATFGGEGTGGNVGAGAMAIVTVEPAGARYYRSQVTEEELRLATPGTTGDGHPVINYEARFPNAEPWISEGKAGLPILNMRDGNEIVHSDLNAIIAGFTHQYPPNPSLPNRQEPFREFTALFHDETSALQAFPAWYDPVSNPTIAHTLHGVRDSFMINYGSGGIGSEIIANRLGVGPMWDCLDCAYEEFFLTSFAVGDPAMLVDIPANTGLTGCQPSGAGCDEVGPKATRAYYPDDPSNVHHSYTGDHVKIRNAHAGPKEQHIFHLHNHQWLFNPNDDNSNYLDAQALGPGSGYTYEINFGGSGNRNKTAGDAIFHCHFYPHFAQGMWGHWRNHDVLELGTRLAVTGGPGDFHQVPFALRDGTPAFVNGTDGPRVRALPDGEILAGTPIPAVVPLPGKPMPPLPGRVTLVTKNTNPGLDEDPITPGVQNFPEASVANVDRTDRYPDDASVPALLRGQIKNPGYPFWVAGVDCGGPGADGLGDASGCGKGIVGQRPATPPLDMLTTSEAQALRDSNDPLFQHPGFVAAAGGFDGGLPRHALEGFRAVEPVPGLGRTDPGIVEQHQTRLDFMKEIHKAKPVYFPEQGTDVEQAAMRFHAQRFHPTFTPENGPAQYRTNGQLPVPGAPFMEPCIDDNGDLFQGGGTFFGGVTGNGDKTATNPRVYKAANIQIDAVFNKVGYHFPQQRIISLWEDIAAFQAKAKPPEPFVIRMNTFDCTQYYHANLVPKVYELDDYQVRTPTDIIGQHIHLPKWDLTTADGSANGWNYEDGTLSPGAVEERIAAINTYNAAVGDPSQLTAETGPVPGGSAGARVTIQRWFADPVVNSQGQDRGLGIIFTHDHYGPSTHQQIGLYATVLTEPAGSTWKHNESGTPFYTRGDGGPTSWQAIVTPVAAGQPSYREFYFEFSDFQHAYEAGAAGIMPDAVPDSQAFRTAINPSFRQQAAAGSPDIVRFPPTCPGGVPRPCPEAISADDVGMLVVNYRNEPVGLRVFNPGKTGPDGQPGSQTDGAGGDLALALQSRADRAIPALNTPLGNTPYPALNRDVGNGDPFTPILRGYVGDLVRLKIQAGAHEHEHNTTVHGVKWLQSGSSFGRAPNSGWRNAQNPGISEQFNFGMPFTAVLQQAGASADYAYTIDASQDGWWSGVWGIMRTYNQRKQDLAQLNNGIQVPVRIGNTNQFNGVCPRIAPRQVYDVTAVLANAVLPKPASATIPANNAPTDNVGGHLNPAGGTLVYNPRTGPASFRGPLHDPTAVLYVRTDDLVPLAGADTAARRRDPTVPVRLRPTVPVEPLTLRAGAGDCIEVTLRNRLPAVMPDLAGYNTLLQMVLRNRNGAQGVTTFNNNLIRPSNLIGMHPQLVAYDVTRDDGVVVGNNPQGQTLVAPGGSKTYRWYAGDIDATPAGNVANLVATPVELGGSNLSPADKIKQGQKGMVGALVIEPQGSTWTEDADRRAAATVTRPQGAPFRDFAVIFQKGLNLRYGDGAPVENIAAEGGAIPEDAHDAGQKGINYGTEPAWYRFGLAPNVTFGNAPGGLGGVPNPETLYSNQLAGGADPATPVFTAAVGQEVRMRVLEPTGVGRGTTFDLHGYGWQRDPYLEGVVPSQTIGCNPHGLYLGHQESITPSAHFDVVVHSACEGFSGVDVAGDWLFRDHASFGNTDGLWGILRVQ